MLKNKINHLSWSYTIVNVLSRRAIIRTWPLSRAVLPSELNGSLTVRTQRIGGVGNSAVVINEEGAIGATKIVEKAGSCSVACSAARLCSGGEIRGEIRAVCLCASRGNVRATGVQEAVVVFRRADYGKEEDIRHVLV
jgi:hypothetical protein